MRVKKSLGALFLSFFLLLFLWRSGSSRFFLGRFASAAGRLSATAAAATAVAGASAAAFATTTAVATVAAMLLAAALAAIRLCFTARSLFCTAGDFLRFATIRFRFAARCVATATTATMQAAKQATMAARASVAAKAAAASVATTAEQTAKAATVATRATVAAAATMTEGVRLRFETDQNGGHSRQSQHHFKCIALHQNTSKHMKKKVVTIKPFLFTARSDGQRRPAIVLAVALLRCLTEC